MPDCENEICLLCPKSPNYDPKARCHLINILMRARLPSDRLLQLVNLCDNCGQWDAVVEYIFTRWNFKPQD